MFTGIIEELATVKSVLRRANAGVVVIRAGAIARDVKIGDSVSVNGACLTVVGNVSGSLSFEVMAQTAGITTIGSLRTGQKVNLERSLKVGDRLSGHFVTGHVDCIGTIRRKSYARANLCFEVAIPREFMKYVVPRGSIALDGISLTVAVKKADAFSVCIIPHTLKSTTLAFKGPCDKVNIECDILAKRP